jgi:hypothetical protein
LTHACLLFDHLKKNSFGLGHSHSGLRSVFKVSFIFFLYTTSVTVVGYK